MTATTSLSTSATVDLYREAPDALRTTQLETPAKPSSDWTLEELQTHLQWAVDIEHYTILYYMSAWFSIKDQASEAARLIKSVVNQEMLHMQSAANLANAFGTALTIKAPLYGVPIPHLDFKLHTGKVDPTKLFAPHSTHIGAFDALRLNTMCLIEFPDWFEESDLNRVELEAVASDDEYGSIGELYAAIERNVKLRASDLIGNNHQVDFFTHFYPDAHLTVSDDGKAGLDQALDLIRIIVDQGEGKGRHMAGVDSKFQNKADDMQPASDHFDKFNYLRGQPFPETWELTILTEDGRRAQRACMHHYAGLLDHLRVIFNAARDGAPAQEAPFGPVMFNVGAAISACWQNGALPVFSVHVEDGCEVRS